MLNLSGGVGRSRTDWQTDNFLVCGGRMISKPFSYSERRKTLGKENQDLGSEVPTHR